MIKTIPILRVPAIARGPLMLLAFMLAGCGGDTSNTAASPSPNSASSAPAQLANDIEDASVQNGVELLAESDAVSVARADRSFAIASKPLASGTNYISDLDWVSSRNDYGPVERDQSVGGTAANDGNKPLIINGASFTKGLGVHGESEVVIALAKRCTRFKAAVGINDFRGRYPLNSLGSMRFQVWGDAGLLAETGVVTGATAVQRFDIDVTNVTTLRLVTKNNGTPGRSADSNNDHGDWATAIVTCAGDSQPPTGPISDAQAVRFLNQATYGATLEEIARVKQLGYAGWIDAQFSAPRIDTHQAYLNRNGPIGCSPCDSNYINEVMESFWYQVVRSDDQLRQRMVLALSEIFVVSALNSNGALEIVADAHASYHDMLSRNAFGNFRTLLDDVSTHPAMAHYLSHFKNEKEDPQTGRQPDENYAREVMQLFTIGLNELNIDGTPKLDGNGNPIPTYTRFDVEGLAKVYTGWGFGGNHTWDTHPQTAAAWYPQMKNYPTYHSASEKRLLRNVVIPAGTNAQESLRLAHDALFNHPNVGPFIGSQLIKRFVTSNPSKAYVARVARVFNDNGQGVRGDLKAVLKAILLDEEARNDARVADLSYGKLREPLVRYGNFMRTFKVRSLSGYYRIWNLEDPIYSLGQNPMRAPSVFNWFRPDFSPQGPVRDAGLIAPEFQIVHEGTVTSWVNFIAGEAENTTTWSREGRRQYMSDEQYRDYLAADLTREVELASNSGALVDHLGLLLTAGQLTAATRTTILDALNSIAASDVRGRQARVSAAITLVMASPEYMVQK